MKILDVPQSGSIAGTTSSRNRFGQYRRTRAVPVNPNTSRQSTARAILSGCSTNWASLDSSEQASWEAWSALHPFTDSLGQPITLSGAQAFVSVNCALVNASFTAVTVPPVDPLPDPPVLGVVTIDEATFDVAFTPTPVPALHKLIIWTSPPKSLGTSFNRDWRFASAIAAAQASPADILSEITAKFGVPVAGTRFFTRLRLLRSDGGYSPWSNINVTDVAP